MVKETAFYFEIHEDVGLVFDDEGNPGKAYMTIKVDTRHISADSIPDILTQTVSEWASNLYVRPEHIKPISKAQYLQCTAEYSI